MSSLVSIDNRILEICTSLGVNSHDSGLRLSLSGGSYLLSSDCCLKLAKVLSRAPEEIGREFEGAFQDLGGVSVRVDNGFLNFTILDESTFHWGSGERRKDSATVLVSLPGLSGPCPNSEIRILSAACLHLRIAQLADCDVSLLLSGEERSLQRFNVFEFFRRQIVKDAEPSELPSIDEIRGLEPPVILWVHPDRLEQSFRSFGSLGRAHEILYPLRKVASPRWLVPSLTADTWSRIRTMDDESLLSLWLLFASSRSAVDVFPETVSYQERDNIWWFLNSTLSRVSAVCSAVSRLGGVQGIEDIESVPALDIPIQGVPWMLSSAIRFGEVTALISLVEDLLFILMTQLNHPDIRAKLMEPKQLSCLVAVERWLREIRDSLARG